jgi:hypothetical protein
LKKDRHVHPRFKAGLGIFITMILASVAFLMSAAATPLTAPAEGACPEQAELRPVMIDVPADGTVSFGIADLAPSAVNALTCVEMAAIEASSFVAHASEGVVAVVPGPQLAMAGWTGRGVLDTTQRFEFTPKPGFSGVSQGWEFAITPRMATMRSRLIPMLVDSRSAPGAVCWPTMSTPTAIHWSSTPAV